jgi:hypothetical protein
VPGPATDTRAPGEEHDEYQRREGEKTALILIVFLAAAAHFLIPTDQHDYHKVHIILRKLSFLAPVAAAARIVPFHRGFLSTVALSNPSCDATPMTAWFSHGKNASAPITQVLHHESPVS